MSPALRGSVTPDHCSAAVKPNLMAESVDLGDNKLVMSSLLNVFAGVSDA